jgi:hypothetical protein
MGGFGRLAGIATVGAHRASVASLGRRVLAGFGAYWRYRLETVIDALSADMTRLPRRSWWVSAMLDNRGSIGAGSAVEGARSLGDGGVEKDLPIVPNRCGRPTLLMLRSISGNSWRRRAAAYSFDPDFLAARRLPSGPRRRGEALTLRVVVSSTSARRPTRPKWLAAVPQWPLAQRPLQHPRPQDRGSLGIPGT